MDIPFIYDLTLPDLALLLKSWGEPTFRAKQIWTGLYQQFWNTPDEFTNLPVKLREKLKESVQFDLLNPTLKLELKRWANTQDALSTTRWKTD